MFESIFTPLIGLPVYVLLGIYGFIGSVLFAVVFTAQIVSVIFAPMGGAIYAWRSRATGISNWDRFVLGAAYFSVLVAPWIYLNQQIRGVGSRQTGEMNLRWVYTVWLAFIIAGPAPIVASGFLNTAGATPAWILVCTSLVISATIFAIANKRLSRVSSTVVTGSACTAQEKLSTQQVYVRTFSYISATIVSVPISWMILGLVFN